MFNFTTTTFINENVYLDGGKMFETKVDSKGAPMFQVKGVSNFYKNDQNVASLPALSKVTRKVYSLPVIATASFNAATAITTAGNYTLELYLRLTQDSQNSLYANDMAYKGKPFLYEFSVATSELATIGAKIVSVIKEASVLFQDYAYFTVSNTGNVVNFTAKDEYTFFFKVDLGKYNAVTFDYDKVAVTLTKTAPKSGFGTYKYLSENLRLPNTHWVSPGGLGQDELPIKGTNYDQYVLTLTHTRPELGGLNGVGEKVTSVTTHVFYVANSGGPALPGEPAEEGDPSPATPAPTGVSLDFLNELKEVTTVEEIDVY